MMPIYDYKCPKCGTIENVFAKMDDKTLQHECGETMERLMSYRVSINMGVPTGGYYDETLGAHIETMTQKRRLMREQGVSERGSTPKVEDRWV